MLRNVRPPLQEGHHVTGINDLVGSETQDAIRSDRRSMSNYLADSQCTSVTCHRQTHPATLIPPTLGIRPIRFTPRDAQAEITAQSASSVPAPPTT